MIRKLAHIAPLLLPLAMLWCGCQKIDLPPEQPSQPVFVVQAQLDGQPLQIAAGVDDYYLFTEATLDSSNVYTYSGSFRKLSCNALPCPGTLSFSFFDLAPTTQPDALQAVYPGKHPMAALPHRDSTWTLDSLKVYELALDASGSLISPNATPTFVWTLPDSTTLSGKQLTIQLPHIDPAGTSVTLELYSSNGCSSSQTRTIDLPSPMPATPCAVWIDTVNQPAMPAPLALKAVAVGVAPLNFIWSSGDTSTLQWLTNTTPQSAFSVTLTDAVGCKASAEIAAPSLLQGQFCAARFDWHLQTKTVLDSQLHVINLPYHPAAAVIAFTDHTGRLFSSLFGPQGADTGVEILSVQPYDANEQGQPTLQLQIRFSCTLWSTDGQSLQLQDGTGTIAVARGK